MRLWKWRHRWAIDLRGVTDREHKRVLQHALNALDYPLSRIRRNTGRRVPVSVSDLSRFAKLVMQGASAEHFHVHQGDEDGHVLAATVNARRAALGLYWLPTSAHPAGRIEIDQGTFSNPDLAREVMIAELAHAVDYGVPITDDQKKAIMRALHGGAEGEHGDHGWFEERGGQDYWSWQGENLMGLFMAAFAPALPRPLEARQPWTHANTPHAVEVTRQVLS